MLRRDIVQSSIHVCFHNTTFSSPPFFLSTRFQANRHHAKKVKFSLRQIAALPKIRTIFGNPLRVAQRLHEYSRNSNGEFMEQLNSRNPLFHEGRQKLCKGSQWEVESTYTLVCVCIKGVSKGCTRRFEKNSSQLPPFFAFSSLSLRGGGVRENLFESAYTCARGKRFPHFFIVFFCSSTLSRIFSPHFGILRAHLFPLVFLTNLWSSSKISD